MSEGINAQYKELFQKSAQHIDYIIRNVADDYGKRQFIEIVMDKILIYQDELNSRKQTQEVTIKTDRGSEGLGDKYFD